MFARSCRRPCLLLAVSLSGCALHSAPPPLPAHVTIGDELRSCLHPVLAPKALSGVVSVPSLRLGSDDEHNARLADQRAAIDCGQKLAEVILLVDAFNLVHRDQH